VLAEVDYFLRDERRGIQLFVKDGTFTYAPPTLGQLTRAMEVDRRLPTSIWASSTHRWWRWESLNIRRLATRDVRHFAVARLRRAFDLVVHSSDPDQS
jgi:hypothetical protein